MNGYYGRGVNNIFHPSIREQALVEALAHPLVEASLKATSTHAYGKSSL